MASEGRLDALKLSAKSLVTTVLSHKQASTYVKIGIVPFADYVNVGLSNRGSSWMNVPKDYTTTDPNYCSISYPDASSSNCHDAQGVWNNDGVPTKYTYQVCDWVMGNPVTTCSPQTYQHKWYGCVGSRPSPMDQSIGSASQAYPGILDTGCTNEITDLTDKLATLTSAIDAMVASGNTYIPSGLLWGWNMLDSSAPLTTAKSKSAMAAIHGSKSLVLMTDGDNTLSPGNGADYKYHWGNDVVYANKMTADLCQNIKDDGVNVFTVAFKVANTTSLQILQDCASSPTQAYDATNDAELQAAFDQIGSSLAQLRITK
jgi:von Willebrand factor type A domain